MMNVHSVNHISSTCYSPEKFMNGFNFIKKEDFYEQNENNFFCQMSKFLSHLISHICVLQSHTRWLNVLCHFHIYNVSHTFGRQAEIGA